MPDRKNELRLRGTHANALRRECSALAVILFYLLSRASYARNPRAVASSIRLIDSFILIMDKREIFLRSSSLSNKGPLGHNLTRIRHIRSPLLHVTDSWSFDIEVLRWSTFIISRLSFRLLLASAIARNARKMHRSA